MALQEFLNVTSGDLTEKVTIRRKVTAPDGQGGRTTTWALLGHQPDSGLWASVVALSTAEQLRAAAIGAKLTYTVTIRYRADVTPQMRVTWRPYQATTLKTLEIHGVPPVDGKREWVQLDCSEVI